MSTTLRCSFFLKLTTYFLAANPFSRRESHNTQALWTYKILTVVSWLLVVIVSILYTVGAPKDGKHRLAHSIIGQNKAHPTPFSLNAIITPIYW